MALPDLGSDLPDVALRTAIIYVLLVLALRIGGKREVGQLSILELVVLLVVADAVQNSMVGQNTTLLGGIVAAGTLFLLDRGLRAVADRFRPVRVALEGEPALLVRDGRALEAAMRREGVEPYELRAALRAHGVARVDDVELAVLETDGTISVVPRREEGRVTGVREGRPL
ncbi:MAG TPA: YetF domain-containing protein [Candidatus Limnocylindrales bacterium]|nr:YetF domain-containing protein [Candidatus Limnocylindrales bacterium]